MIVTIITVDNFIFRLSFCATVDIYLWEAIVRIKIITHQALFTIDINGQMDEQVTKYLFGTLQTIFFSFIAFLVLGAYVNQVDLKVK